METWNSNSDWFNCNEFSNGVHFEFGPWKLLWLKIENRNSIDWFNCKKFSNGVDFELNNKTFRIKR